MEQVSSGHYHGAGTGRSEVTNTCRTQKNGVIQLPPSTSPTDILAMLNGGGGRGTGGRDKRSGVMEGKRKRTEDGHGKIKRMKEKMKNKTSFPLTIYGHHHNI